MEKIMKGTIKLNCYILKFERPKSNKLHTWSTKNSVYPKFNFLYVAPCYNIIASHQNSWDGTNSWFIQFFNMTWQTTY